MYAGMGKGMKNKVLFISIVILLASFAFTIPACASATTSDAQQSVQAANDSVYPADYDEISASRSGLPVMGVPDYSMVYGVGALITGTIAFRKNKK